MDDFDERRNMAPADGENNIPAEEAAGRARKPRSEYSIRNHDRRSKLFDEMWAEWVEYSREAAECAVFGYYDCHAGSDLERLLLVPLTFLRAGWFDAGYGGPLDVGRDELTIRPQYSVGPYVLDFAIFVGPFGVQKKEWRIAVECDGHYFHERTKEQATRDRRRDRYLALNGWTVMRFTESEINADPRGCVDQIGAQIEQLVGIPRPGDGE